MERLESRLAQGLFVLALLAITWFGYALLRVME